MDREGHPVGRDDGFLEDVARLLDGAGVGAVAGDAVRHHVTRVLETLGAALRQDALHLCAVNEPLSLYSSYIQISGQWNIVRKAISLRKQQSR